MANSATLASIFKAYDVRGLVPDELDANLCAAIGAGLGRFLREAEGATRLVVGRDMRASGQALSEALMAGAASQGLSLVDVGLCSTDLLYFATGYFDAPGVMCTASHNPAAYNGLKFCFAKARPIGMESGLSTIRDYAEGFLELGVEPVTPRVEHVDVLSQFVAHVHGFVRDELSPFSLIADTANGMGGLIAPAVFADLPPHLEVLFGELDGTFPNHPADPIQPANLVDLIEAVRKSHADVGLAFDGDADRVFLVDELGEAISGSTVTAIVAQEFLRRDPGATVLYNCICSNAVAEVIAEEGGVGVRTRVGHSFIKAEMARTGAVFAGEHSGHYYFRDNFGADSGIIAALVVLDVLSKAKVSLHELRAPFERYAASGEVNTVVKDVAHSIAYVAAHYEAEGASLDYLDGLTVDLGSWWFNLRPSNTEPLLRLNVEATDGPACTAHLVEVQDLIAASQDAV